jgi:hypothetical protein
VSIIVISPLKFKYYTISLIICQSSLFDSLCLNTAQLRNTDDITARLKQIRIFVSISHVVITRSLLNQGILVVITSKVLWSLSRLV